MKNLASGGNNFGDIHEELSLLNLLLTLKLREGRALKRFLTFRSTLCALHVIILALQVGLVTVTAANV